MVLDRPIWGYPAAMSNFMHPVSVIPKRYKEIREDTDFATIEAEYNNGALGGGNGTEFDFLLDEMGYFSHQYTRLMQVLKLVPFGSKELSNLTLLRIKSA